MKSICPLPTSGPGSAPALGPSSPCDWERSSSKEESGAQTIPTLPLGLPGHSCLLDYRPTLYIQVSPAFRKSMSDHFAFLFFLQCWGIRPEPEAGKAGTLPLSTDSSSDHSFYTGAPDPRKPQLSWETYICSCFSCTT